MLAEQPGGAELGAVSVRSVIGHPHRGAAEPNIAIALPHSTEMIAAHEVFTAEEAAGLFATFYRTDTIPEEYVLRSAEAFTATGEHIYLDKH